MVERALAVVTFAVTRNRLTRAERLESKERTDVADRIGDWPRLGDEGDSLANRPLEDLTGPCGHTGVSVNVDVMFNTIAAQ
jgi:hypothetical protein